MPHAFEEESIMGSPYQQQALQRKVLYIGLILVLFSGAWVWRHYIVDVQANNLAIREQSRGEVELTGAVVRLTLTGSRGLATCVLWVNAIEKQKKNQWNELELLVRSLTKLQPHFTTPWLFQSWNLAYNVSVESDRPSDKFFYVSRGVNLLADGERKNRDNPDLRWSIGFYLQHKIGQSDETNVMRSLFQLSCIPPNERDPARLWSVREGGDQEVNLKEFEKFCQDHPQLIRRLHEGIRRETKLDQRRQFKCERVEEVVQFLQDNFRIPSQWEDTLPSPLGAWQKKADRLKPLADRFPVLPPPRPTQKMFDPDTLTYDSQLRDEDDVYAVSRSWYSYAQEPIPAPGDLPGSNVEITDRAHQRRPRYMTTLIFRNYPAQGARYTAERLQDEGWYDESGYEIPDWFRDQGDKFTSGEPARVGTGRKWALDAWRLAYDLWRRHGEANHLIFNSAADEQNMRDLAEAFRKRHNLTPGSMAPSLRKEDLSKQEQEEYFAYQFMRDYESYRMMSNFAHHYNRSFVEAKEVTVTARKLFFEAEALRLRNAMTRALEKYQDPNALAAWRDKVLLKYKEFRRDDSIQETTYEIQLKYIDLYTELSGNSYKAQVAGLTLIPGPVPCGAGACPVAFAAWLPPLIRQSWENPILGGPFELHDSEGVPLVPPMIRERVLNRLYPQTGVSRPATSPSSAENKP
jgi:hypothetical protein